MTTPTYAYRISITFAHRCSKVSCSRAKNEGSLPIIDAPVVRTSELVSHGYFIHDSPTVPDKCPTAGKVPSLYRMTLVKDGANWKPRKSPTAWMTSRSSTAWTTRVYVVAAPTTTIPSTASWMPTPPAMPSGTRSSPSASGCWYAPSARKPAIPTRLPMIWVNLTPFTPNDHYRRQLFTSTIRLRNR